MSERTRTVVLVALLAIVAAVVVFDTLRKKGVDADAPAETAQLSDELDALERQRALVDHEAEWGEALARAQRAWNDVRAMSVEASTPELAVADFRAILVDTARALGLEVTNADVLTSRPIEGVPSGMDRVHELEVRLSISSHDPRALQRYIDAVEHLPRTITHVARVSMTGPGVAQLPEEVRATLTVRALGVTPAPPSNGSDA